MAKSPLFKLPVNLPRFGIPLAWLQLKREKVRLVVAISGFSFAVLLIFLQLGFLNALFASVVRFHRGLNADIVLISPRYVALTSFASFSDRRLYQALGFANVESVTPVYVGFAQWTNPQTQATRAILVYGVDPEAKAFNLPEVERNIAQTRLADTYLFDETSKLDYGPIAETFLQGKPVQTELSIAYGLGRRAIKVGGLFRMGTSFAADGNLITSQTNFLRLFGSRAQIDGLVEVGLIRLKAGADRKRTLADLRTALPRDVRVLTKAEFIAFEQSFWGTIAPVGLLFNVGSIIGVIVGSGIVAQILYTDVSVHLPEYATLKAMGFTNRYLLTVVFQEALILAVLGYIPGLVISWAIYWAITAATGLPVNMDLDRIVFVFSLTLLMALISGGIAVRKLKYADPADIF
jgi:putative ABC transport system permease protein